MSASDRYRGVVIDLDGTVYRGGRLLPGADAAIDALRERGLPVLFFSNNPTRSPASFADRLGELGIEAAPEEVLTSGAVTRAYLDDEHAGERVFVVGESGLRAQLAEAAVTLTDDPREADVLVGSIDREFTYDRLTTALRALDDGDGRTTFVGTDPDRTIPTADGAMPGSGAILAAIAAVAGREPDPVLGKPSTYAVAAALDRLDVDPRTCLVVGDRLDTDVAMGRRAGMETAVVLSGVETRATVDAAGARPDHVLDSIEALPSVFKS